MYQIANFEIPKERRFGEYAIELIQKIKTGVDEEQSKEELFRMSYPIMIKELYKYTNLRPAEELVSDLSVAFMNTIRFFNIDRQQSKTSFISYYKTVFQHEVMRNYFGGYIVKYPEKRKEFKYFHDGIGSLNELDDYLHQQNHDGPRISVNDILEDKTVNIEDDYMDITFMTNTHAAIDEIFTGNGRGRGPRVEKAKLLFTIYIDSILNDKPMTYDQIAAVTETTKSNICSIVKRYLPRLQEKLREYGYDYI